MRIVTVLTSLGMGGAEKLALAVAERMANRGHDVALLSLMPRLPEQWPTTLPVTYLDIRKNPASVAAGFRRGRHFLREFRPDMVHSHSFHANILARLLTIGAPRAVVISNVHNVYEGGRMRMLAYRLTDRWSVRTVAISQAAADSFIRLKAIPKHKCSVRALGIDTQKFAPDAQRRASTRKAMGADSAFVWLCVGRIAPAKDYPNLLQAFAKVERQRSDTLLWIAGGGSEAACQELESLANDLGIREKALFLGLQRDMPALLDAADGFVLGSAWEGLPQVIAEAMAMEKPVVATDVGGVRELLGDEGTRVPPKDPEALAAAMLRTMGRNRDEGTLEGKAARELIQRRFSIDAVADGWEALYEQEIGSSSQ
ncbi:MAG: glycosyltransferase [Terracidiphilus sp.]|nr:glycosyltransferase [Terracidiphilus sp.]MDR3796634.1 glycosyltransferase [Terracidiphilus sp.]